jgi:hypothetical protein
METAGNAISKKALKFKLIYKTTICLPHLFFFLDFNIPDINQHHELDSR